MILFFDLPDQSHELGHSLGPFAATVDNLAMAVQWTGRRRIRALGRYHLSRMPHPVVARNYLVKKSHPDIYKDAQVGSVVMLW